MIRYAAGAASIALAAGALFLLGELHYLAPYRLELLRRYGAFLALCALAAFVNLLVGALFLQRRFLLKGAGQKLRHLDREIQTGESPLSPDVAELLGE